MNHWGSSYFGRDSQTPFSSLSRHAHSRQDYYAHTQDLFSYKLNDPPKCSTSTVGPSDANGQAKLWVYRVVHLTDLTLASFIRRQGIEVLDVQQISHKEAAYKSFLVTVHAKDAPVLLHKTFWPGLVSCTYWQDQPDTSRGGVLSRRSSARESVKGTQEKGGLFPKLFVRNEPIPPSSNRQSAQVIKDRLRKLKSGRDDPGRKQSIRSAQNGRGATRRILSSKVKHNGTAKKKSKKSAKQVNNNSSLTTVKIESVLVPRVKTVKGKKKKLHAEDIGLENKKVKNRKGRSNEGDIFDERDKKEVVSKIEVAPKNEIKRNSRDGKKTSGSTEEKYINNKTHSPKDSTGNPDDSKQQKPSNSTKNDSGKVKDPGKQISTEQINSKSKEVKPNVPEKFTSKSTEPNNNNNNEKQHTAGQIKDARNIALQKTKSPENVIDVKQESEKKTAGTKGDPLNRKFTKLTETDNETKNPDSKGTKADNIPKKDIHGNESNKQNIVDKDTKPNTVDKDRNKKNRSKGEDRPRDNGKVTALTRSRHVLPEIPIKTPAIAREDTKDEQITEAQKYPTSKHPNWVMSLSGLLIMSPEDVVTKLLGPDFDALLSQDVVSDDELFLGVKVLAHASRAKTNPEMLQRLVYKIWQPHVINLIKTFTVTVERLYPDRAERYFWDIAEFLDLYVSGKMHINQIPGLINTCLMEVLALSYKSYVSEDIVKVFRVMQSHVGKTND